jgi:hypothetical protein
MMAHGFGTGTLRDLVRTGFASEQLRSITTSRRSMVVTWLTITAAGRLAIG